MDTKRREMIGMMGAAAGAALVDSGASQGLHREAAEQIAKKAGSEHGDDLRERCGVPSGPGRADKAARCRRVKSSRRSGAIGTA